MVRKQIFISFVSVFIIGFTGLLAIPVLSRLLTPEEMGKLFFILAIVSFLQIFEGLKPVITYKLNEKKYDESFYIKVFNQVNFIFIVAVAY